ncbi:MAG: protein-methionine-sulfoxide reductase catalytic subunit MsrP [Rhodospirillales bacterium]|nr:protein-methionine-sulfoxide reductase catalytic subunit MsrP [Rhodospirillales bacterium]
MLLRFRDRGDVASSEITPKRAYLDRRRFIAAAAGLGVGSALAGLAKAAAPQATPAEGSGASSGTPRGLLSGAVKGPFGTDETPTPVEAATHYNNFYEFGTGKEDPAQLADSLKARPWSVTIDGLCAKPATLDVDEIIKANRLEERTYRMRCVEAWSMVIPWVGVPFADIVKRAEPLGSAKFVAMQTLLDPKQMPGQRRGVLDWPYKEGLRLDEAMHPLTLLAVGLYGEVLPNQNGAPIRLVTPWKYGFKGIKSIVRISFVEEMPATAWNLQAPYEYGFYANVNPDVDHPRWSQKRERRIGEFFRRETLPFNGYGEQVASLYSGMDLRKWF